MLLVTAFVAVLTTWPLAAHLNHAADDPFDPRFQAWTIDWVQHAIAHPAHLYDANIFSPDRATLAYSDSLIGVAVLVLPLRWFGMTPIGVLNVAVLLGFTLSAAAAYAFGKVVTRSVVAACVTGAAFAFGEFGTYESAHVQTVFRPGVALAATAAWILADRAESHRRLWTPTVAVVVIAAWQCSMSFYTGAFTLAAAIVVLAVRSRSLDRRGVVAAVVAVGGAGAGALLLALPYLGRHAAIPGFHWTIADLRLEGADFLHVDSRVALWGGALGRGRPWPQFPPPLFPGLTLIGLGLAGAVTGWRDGGRRRRVVITGLVLLVVGATAALGTSDSGWRQYAPYRLVFEFMPGGQALRATFRAWMLGLLGLGLLAGIGADAAVSRLRSVLRPALATALVALVAVGGVVAEGYRHRSHLAPVGVQPVDVALARLPGRGGVLYLPVGGGGPAYLSILAEADVVYRTTAHRRPTPNGYSGYFPDSYFRMTQIVRSLPGQPGLKYLQSIGTRYVVVPPVPPDSPWVSLMTPDTAAPLRLVGRYGSDLLYELPPT